MVANKYFCESQKRKDVSIRCRLNLVIPKSRILGKKIKKNGQINAKNTKNGKYKVNQGVKFGFLRENQKIFSEIPKKPSLRNSSFKETNTLSGLKIGSVAVDSSHGGSNEVGGGVGVQKISKRGARDFYEELDDISSELSSESMGCGFEPIGQIGENSRFAESQKSEKGGQKMALSGALGGEVVRLQALVQKIFEQKNLSYSEVIGTNGCLENWPCVDILETLNEERRCYEFRIPDKGQEKNLIDSLGRIFGDEYWYYLNQASAENFSSEKTGWKGLNFGEMENVEIFDKFSDLHGHLLELDATTKPVMLAMKRASIGDSSKQTQSQFNFFKRLLFEAKKNYYKVVEMMTCLSHTQFLRNYADAHGLEFPVIQDAPTEKTERPIPQVCYRPMGVAVPKPQILTRGPSFELLDMIGLPRENFSNYTKGLSLLRENLVFGLGQREERLTQKQQELITLISGALDWRDFDGSSRVSVGCGAGNGDTGVSEIMKDDGFLLGRRLRVNDSIGNISKERYSNVGYKI